MEIPQESEVLTPLDESNKMLAFIDGKNYFWLLKDKTKSITGDYFEMSMLACSVEYGAFRAEFINGVKAAKKEYNSTSISKFENIWQKDKKLPFGVEKE